MKSFSNILATIIVALFLLSFGMKSEAVGQTLDCEGDPCVNLANCATWITPLTPLTLTPDPNCPTCTIKVFYKYRDNSNCTNPCPGAPPFEFQIDYILSDGSCFYPCNGNPAQYQFGDTDVLYMLGLFALVKNFSLPNMNGNCGPIYRNYKGASCKKEYITPGGDVFIMTCEEYECCIQNLQYCVNQGQESLIKTDIVVPSNNCEDDPDGLECKFSCLWEWEDSILPKSTKITESLDENTFNVRVSEYNKSLNLNIEGELEGNLSIVIFNSNAQTVFFDEKQVNQDIFEQKIATDWITGSYYIMIKLDDVVIKSQKFILMN